MATAPYDTIGTVLNAARVRLNDAIQSLGGDVLTNTQPFTLQVVNNAWQWLQNQLLSVGYSGFARLKNDLIITGIPASGSNDPAIQSTLTWAGFNDGVTNFPGIVLPQNFISPLKLWERANGYGQNFRMMDQTLNGLPNGPKQARNLTWDWRNETLCFPGTTVTWDLRVRCLIFLPDFTALTDATQPVPIMRALDAFSNAIAAEMAAPRGDSTAQMLIQAAKDGAVQIYSRDTSQPAAFYKPSEENKMRDVYTPGGPQ